MPSDQKIQPTHPRILLLVVLLGVFAFALLQSLINPVLPVLQRDLGTTQGSITWVMTAFLLSASVLTPVLGRLGDRYGKDRVLVASLTALAVGSVISALAPNIAVMVVGRAVQGAGGGVLPLTFGIIRDEMPRERVPGAIGITAALAAVGGGVGVVLSGPLTDLFGTRSLFWLPLLLAIAAALAVHLVVPPSPARSDTGISWLSVALMAAWLVALLLPLSQGPRWGWSSNLVIGMLAAAALLAVGWTLIERRSTSPLVDIRMMRVTAVWTTNLVSLLFGVVLFSVMAFLPTFVQTPPAAGYGFGVSVTQAGLLLLPMTALMFVAGLVSARLVRRLGPRVVLVAASALNVAAVAAIAFQHDRQWHVPVAMGLLGISLGLAFATMSNVIAAAVRPDQTGVANGVTANVRTIGGALGIAVVGGTVSTHTPPGGLPTEVGYTLGFAVLGIAGTVALLTSLLIPRHPGHTSHP
ncbi:MFS transporter [Micromonospora acroterricola]|uniref:MFS transporter n=1 Tax=Micromonospora acroterricola TaxID=2202421 RepID=A0A317CZH6_9ACTN|nr:MFS transporter [Micromonospora acroterricola]PWR07330.1 MFS transporter [Micromonospora acroterricola]